MYIEPTDSTPCPRPNKGGQPGSDRLQSRDVDAERAIQTPANAQDDDDFACVCHIHVEERDGRTCYRLVLERD